MANEQNLIPLTERGKEDAKRIRQMGQAAQVASRRRKRSMREAADLYLSLPPADKRNWNKLARRGLEADEIDNQMAVIVGLTERAIRGDAKAAKVLIDLLGDAPVEDASSLDAFLRATKPTKEEVEALYAEEDG